MQSNHVALGSFALKQRRHRAWSEVGVWRLRSLGSWAGDRAQSCYELTPSRGMAAAWGVVRRRSVEFLGPPQNSWEGCCCGWWPHCSPPFLPAQPEDLSAQGVRTVSHLEVTSGKDGALCEDVASKSSEQKPLTCLGFDRRSGKDDSLGQCTRRPPGCTPLAGVQRSDT